MKAARRLLEQLGVEIRGVEPTTSVDVSHKNLNAAQARILADLLRTSLTLVCLKLGYNDLRDEGAQIVAHALEHHCSVTSLDLGFNKVGDLGAQALARCLAVNRTLRTLYLSGNSIRGAGFKALSSALQQNQALTALHLTGNAGGQDGAAFLAQALSVNVTLSTLYMSGNAIGPHGAASLSEALAQNTTTRKLYLSDDLLGDLGCVMLANALAHHKAIEVLELSFNSISSKSVEHMINSLWSYTSLQILSLDNNKVGDEGARLLARVLPTLLLEELNVGFNEIGNEGVTELIKAVVSNSTLRVLMLSGNAITTEGAREVAFMLSHNTELQTLYLDHMSIGQAGERYISAAVASSRDSALRNITGFGLGTALVQLGSPPQAGGFPPFLESFSNEQVLQYLKNVYRTHDRIADRAPTNYQDRDPQSPARVAGSKRAKVTSSLASEQREQDYYERDALELKDDGLLSDPSQEDKFMADQDAKAQSNGHAPFSVHEQLVWNEQQRLKGFPSDKLQNLRDLSALPFDPAELWELHQFYFSPPPPQPSLSNDVQLPKRQGNRRTVSRISCFPRLKYHLELLKADSDDSRILTLLRQLQHLERLVDELCDPRRQHDVDVEAILLDLL